MQLNKVLTVKDALELVMENYKEYGIYVAQGRAYPCLEDGAKSVQKRVIYSLAMKAPRSIVKVAEASGYCLDIHPHPSAVPAVIVSLGDNGNNLSFIDKQGNFGNKSKGIEASAPRYIGCRLSDLALQLTCDGIEYCPAIVGELDKPEPEALPTLLPLCFINGMSGIPSGLPRLNIPCLDVKDLIKYYLEILEHKDLNYIPKTLPKPNLGVNIASSKAEWENLLKTGKGSVKTSPIMSIDKNNVIVIEALPSSKSIESIRKIVEKEILLDKIDLINESTDKVRIVIKKVPKKQVNMQEIFKRVKEKLQTNESYNMAFYDKEHIYVPCSFDKVVKANLKYLIEVHTVRLEEQIKSTNLALEVLKIIEKLKKADNLKALFSLDYKDACTYLVVEYKCSEDIAQKVLSKPISYLTKEHKKEIEDLKNQLKLLKNDKSDVYGMLIRKYDDIKIKLSKVIVKNSTKFVNK